MIIYILKATTNPKEFGCLKMVQRVAYYILP